MGFSDLISIIDVLFTLAPILIGLSILILINKMVHDALKVFYIFIALLIGIILINPVGYAEPITNSYTDKKSFDYLNICNTFICVNESEFLGESKFVQDDEEYLDSQDWLYLNSSETSTKPTKLIQWEPNNKSVLFLISKMVYNFSSNDVFKIRLQYIPYDISDTTDLRIVYSEYIDKYSPDEVAGSYRYIDNGFGNFKSPYDYAQTSMQRFSNIGNSWTNHTFGSDIMHNPYTFYEKKYGENNTITNFNVSEIEEEIGYTIDTNKYVTITLNPDNFYDSDLKKVYLPYNFINIGLIKHNPLDIIIINSIEVVHKKILKDNMENPFLEYYDFHRERFPEINDTKIIFSAQLIRDDYNNLYIDIFILGITNINPISGTPGTNEYLYYNITGHDYTVNNTLSYPYYYFENPEWFIGYQISINKDITDNSYSIYLYNKFQRNRRDGAGNIYLNYQYEKIHLNLNYGYSYILNAYHYQNITQSDSQISHIANSFKYDIKDNAFTTIDLDEKGDLLLIKDIDNSGFRIPSLNDLSKMIMNTLKPLFSVIQQLQEVISVPLNNILIYISNIQSVVDTINGIIGVIQGTIDLIKSAVDNIETSLNGVGISISTIQGIINSISGFVTNIKDTLINFYDTFMLMYNYFGGLYGIFSAFITYTVNELSNMITIWTSFLGNAVNTLVLYWNLSFSIIGTMFAYFLIFKVSKYNDTGDLDDLFGIFEVLEKIALWFFRLFEALWSVIP